MDIDVVWELKLPPACNEPMLLQDGSSATEWTYEVKGKVNQDAEGKISIDVSGKQNNLVSPEERVLEGFKNLVLNVGDTFAIVFPFVSDRFHSAVGVCRLEHPKGEK